MKTKTLGYVFGNLKNSRGHSIFTILSMIVVTFTVVQVSIHQALSTYDNIKNSRIVGARDALASNIGTYVSLGTTFRSSMHPSLPANVNIELKNCILGGGSPCIAGTEIPFSLYYPLSSDNPNPSTQLQVISGPGATGGVEAVPVFYDDRGKLCTQSSAESCKFFQVSTTFTAHCPGGTPTCGTADTISVRYYINKKSDGIMRLPLARVDKMSAPISRTSILPAAPGSSSGNIVVGLITTTELGGGLSLQDITDAVIAGGITDPDELSYVAA